MTIEDLEPLGGRAGLSGLSGLSGLCDAAREAEAAMQAAGARLADGDVPLGEAIRDWCDAADAAERAQRRLWAAQMRRTAEIYGWTR